MTVLYRATGAEPPDFGRGTFWTMHRENADYVAQVEAATSSLPPSHIYRAEITFGDDLADESIEGILRLVRDKPMRDALPMLHDMLLKRAERGGREWTQFTESDRPWNGVLLYLGDKQLPALPVPRE